MHDIVYNLSMVTMKEDQKRQLFELWNSKKIIVHTRMTEVISKEIARALRLNTMEEIEQALDLYVTILEPGVSAENKKYFWSYKWNLQEFLRRGVPKFDGQSAENYQVKQRIATPEAIIFKRK